MSRVSVFKSCDCELEISKVCFVSTMDTSRIELKAGSEWRFEVDFSQEIGIKVVSGIVEINGTELPNNDELKFEGTKSSIYCIEDAIIEYQGTLSSEYTSEESYMDQYLALSFSLEQLRRQGVQPRVAIFGPKDSGKTCLAKTLVSNAVKLGRTPMVVNLNPAEGVYTVPGALSAVAVNDILDVEIGWGQSIVSGASLLHPVQPTVAYYGYDNIDANSEYYAMCVSKVAWWANSRLADDKEVGDSGLVVDTPALSNKNQGLVDEIVLGFKINVVVVLGNERLFTDLKKRYADKDIKMVKFSKSDGCVEKDEAYIRGLQQQQIKQYFYGDRKLVLSPYTISSVDYEKLQFYHLTVTKHGSGSEDPGASSVLPIGEADEDEKPESTELSEAEDVCEKIEAQSSYLQNAIIAFVYTKTDTKSSAIRAGVMCFGYISDANDGKKKLKVLLPVQGNMPGKIVLLGNYKFVD